MNTKLSQIERSLKLKYRLDNMGNQSGTGAGGFRVPAAGSNITPGTVHGDGGGRGVEFGHPRNKENEQLVAELQRYNGVLVRENGDLKTKVKVPRRVLQLHRLHGVEYVPR